MSDMTVSVTEAKNKLTELLVRVENGEDVFIKRNGKPIAVILKSSGEEAPKRKFGSLAHKDIFKNPDWDRAQNDLDAWLAGDV